MWYNKVVNQDNPGSVVAQAITELYQNLKIDPNRYPIELTARILLGNLPKIILFPMLLDYQIRKLLDDLRAAGIQEIRNDEITHPLDPDIQIMNVTQSLTHHLMM